MIWLPIGFLMGYSLSWLWNKHRRRMRYYMLVRRRARHRQSARIAAWLLEHARHMDTFRVESELRSLGFTREVVDE